MSTTDELPASAKLLNNPEGNGVYQGEVDERGRRHILSWKVPWEDHNEFLETAGGTPVVFSGSGGSSVTVIVPLKFPYADNMYAKRITYRGEGADALVTADRPFPWVIVNVEFATFDYAVESASPFITVRYRGTSYFATIPNVPFVFAGNGEKLGQDVGRIVGEVAIEVTRHRIPDVTATLGILVPLMGKVSSSDVAVDGVTYPAGTLLFPTFDGEKQIITLGGSRDQLSYPVIYKTIPWNRAMRKDGTLDTLVPAPYETADLNPLFT